MVANPSTAEPAPRRPGSIGRLREVYQDTVVKRGRAESFLISLGFLLTSLVTRAVTHAIHDQRFKFLFHNISPSSGLHIHHFVIGILVLLVVGFVGIGFRPDSPRTAQALAIVYGMGAALTLDEFALWLRLEDVYWSPQGRESVDALILAGGIFLVAVQGLGFWRALLRDAVWLLSQRDDEYPDL